MTIKTKIPSALQYLYGKDEYGPVHIVGIPPEAHSVDNIVELEEDIDLQLEVAATCRKLGAPPPPPTTSTPGRAQRRTKRAGYGSHTARTTVQSTCALNSRVPAAHQSHNSPRRSSQRRAPLFPKTREGTMPLPQKKDTRNEYLSHETNTTTERGKCTTNPQHPRGP